MLLPLRQHLGIDRFYNYGNECMNKKYKNLVMEYVSEAWGIARSKYFNLRYTEAVTIYEKLCKNHCNDLATSIYDDGTYELIAESVKFKKTPDEWDDLTQKERRNILKNIDCFFQTSKSSRYQIKP